MKNLSDKVATAEEAFWQSIKTSFPEIKTGDFPPEAAFKLEMALTEAVKVWYTFNLPTPVFEGWKAYPIEDPALTINQGFMIEDIIDMERTSEITHMYISNNGCYIGLLPNGTYWTVACDGELISHSFLSCVDFIEKQTGEKAVN